MEPDYWGGQAPLLDHCVFWVSHLWKHAVFFVKRSNLVNKLYWQQQFLC